MEKERTIKNVKKYMDVDFDKCVQSSNTNNTKRNR